MCQMFLGAKGGWSVEFDYRRMNGCTVVAAP
jgi:hypothetical protein